MLIHFYKQRVRGQLGELHVKVPPAHASANKQLLSLERLPRACFNLNLNLLGAGIRSRQLRRRWKRVDLRGMCKRKSLG